MNARAARLRRVEPRGATGAHAEAAVQPDRDRQREVAGGERGDRLGRSVLDDTEVRGRQAGHRLAASVRHGRVHFDQVHA